MRHSLSAIGLLTALSVTILFTSAEANTTRGLKVVATDPGGKTQGEVQLYDQSFAVIIGIDDYKYLPRDRQLKKAVKDAKGVEATLRKHYKFDRILTLFNQDATRDRILDVLTEELPRDMGENDALFVFWAGHGNQETSRTGEIGYLIPHDGDPKRLRTNITMTELRDTVSKKLPAKHVFYVMDACYSGLLTETRGIDKTARRDLNYLKEITKEPVRQVLTAGGKGEEVLDGGPKGHSVFTGRLIELLESTGDFITANEIQVILKEKVYGDARARNHKQTPAYGTLYGSGDFVFVPSLEQKVTDNKAEIAKLEAELKALDVAEARAQAAASSAEQARRKREADAERRVAEGKLKAEQLKQQQLIDEEKRRQADEAERQRLLVAKSEDDRKLAELKAAAEARRKAVGVVPTIGEFPTAEAVKDEVGRLRAQIAAIESSYQTEIANTREQVVKRYDQMLAAIDQEQKDEFETSLAFNARREKQRGDLARQREMELWKLNVETIASAETAPLREQVRELLERDYVFGPESLTLELGEYDASRQVFVLTIHLRGNVKSGFESRGTLRLPPNEARRFKQQMTAGLVRPEVKFQRNELVEVAVVNDGDNTRRTLADSEYLLGSERKEREREKKHEREWGKYRPEMVRIPAGSFRMGGSDGNILTYPIHTVTVPEFQMARTEVTQAQWREVMGKHTSANNGCDECPVEKVSWEDVQGYLKKLKKLTGKSYRLPSEAEWEYACRAGDSYLYCGGDDLDMVGWWKENSNGTTHPVAQKQANAFGLYDMTGNVSEWVQDCANIGYMNAPTDGSPWLTGKCERRVQRGYFFHQSRDKVGETQRMTLYEKNMRSAATGFRIALSVTKRRP